VWASVRDSVGDSVGDSGYGQHEADWLAFYEFFSEVCGLAQETERLQGLWLQARAAGWYLPHQHICWISERHHRLCRNTQGMIHSEDGPAIAYPDGWEIYALNGVRLSKELVMTPAEALDPQLVTKEQNAEIRREIVRKIGVERLCQRLGATVLDRCGDYELLTLMLGDGRPRPYLKMRNPSLGVYHIEGVAPHIKTVQQAINWRAGDEQTEWQPDVLT
jgi:hypothetical protein